MNLENPKVTVLMPVYNTEKYLRDAIESILNQIFKYFEFLIINDGSTDKSIEIINSYNDPRIRLVHNEKNLGLISTLNKGMDLAKGEYIARMDSDDISAIDRLEKQKRFMDENPGIGVCGSWLKNIKKRCSNIWYYPKVSDEIKSDLIFACSFAHPTVMIRKNLFKEYQLYYSQEYLHAEDYELWTRASKYMDFSNIPEVLFFYRRHKRQASEKHSQVQENNSIRAALKMIEYLGIEPTEEEIRIHSLIVSKKYEYSKEFIQRVNIWFKKILYVNSFTKILSENHLKKTLARRWLILCKKSTKVGIPAWSMYWKSDFSIYNQIKIHKAVFFFLKCLLRVR